jgi:ubiquinone/menaquinone biosynthesis C-methylase UbiE
MKNNIESIVKRSNREVYNDITPEEYEKNESIFNETRQKICAETLKQCAERSGKEFHLDIGTGTGNLLRISQNFFKKIIAVDIGEKLLSKIKSNHPKVIFIAADAENLPFKSGLFNCVTCNALLHHLYSHEKLFSEIYRVLKNGGSVYTDHDPNYFFNRFYHLFYKIRFRGKHGFGSEKHDLSEYHNALSPGINPQKLSEIMAKIGFTDVKITYRLTDRANWSGSAKFAYRILKILNKFIPAKSLKTHFSITAIK